MNNTYHLFLDDFRNPEDCFDRTYNQVYLLGWTIVKNYDEFVKTITEKGMPRMLSLDHDLCDLHYVKQPPYDEDTEKTGYDCAKWLINYCMDNQLDLPETILIHSMNPAGSLNIESLFDSYYKSLEL